MSSGAQPYYQPCLLEMQEDGKTVYAGHLIGPVTELHIPEPEIVKLAFVGAGAAGRTATEEETIAGLRRTTADLRSAGKEVREVLTLIVNPGSYRISK